MYIILRELLRSVKPSSADGSLSSTDVYFHGCFKEIGLHHPQPYLTRAQTMLPISKTDIFVSSFRKSIIETG